MSSKGLERALDDANVSATSLFSQDEATNETHALNPSVEVCAAKRQYRPGLAQYDAKKNNQGKLTFARRERKRAIIALTKSQFVLS